MFRDSLCTAKENLAFNYEGNLPQRARPRGPMRHGAGCTAARIKKIATFRFEANALPFWASFLFPNGISMHAQDGISGPIPRTRRSPAGGIHNAQSAFGNLSWFHRGVGRGRCFSQRRTDQNVENPK